MGSPLPVVEAPRRSGARERELRALAELGHTRDLLARIAPGLARWEAQIRAMWATQCPSCAPGSPAFHACEYRFRREPFRDPPEDQPLCRLWPEREAYEREQSRVRFRRRRLTEAGVVSAELLRLIPPARSLDEVLPVAALAHLAPRQREVYLRGPRQVVAAAQRFLAGEGRHLLLRGTKGTLKTTVAAAVVAAWPRPALWLPMSRIQPAASWDELRPRAEQAPLLVINDVGTEAATETHRSLLAQLITERDDNNLPMVITTNLTAEQLAGGYRDSNWDRLRRGIDCDVVGLSLREVLDGRG